MNTCEHSWDMCSRVCIIPLHRCMHSTVGRVTVLGQKRFSRINFSKVQLGLDAMFGRLRYFSPFSKPESYNSQKDFSDSQPAIGISKVVQESKDVME